MYVNGTQKTCLEGLREYAVPGGFVECESLIVKNEEIEKQRRAEQAIAQKNYEQQQKKELDNYNKFLNNSDAQTLYLAAGKYARDGYSSKANEIYNKIIARFPDSVFAVKASDQLSATSRNERAQDAMNSATREAGRIAYESCKTQETACYSRTNGKGNCYRNCDSLR